MKFGKLLQSRAEELKSTGLTEHFLRYKALKKTLKQISKEDQQIETQNGDAAAGEPACQPINMFAVLHKPAECPAVCSRLMKMPPLHCSALPGMGTLLTCTLALPELRLLSSSKSRVGPPSRVYRCKAIARMPGTVACCTYTSAGGAL